jgi:hypothetical protein
MSKKIEHLVFFQFKNGVAKEQKEALLVKLKSLYGIIDGMEAMSIGLNATEEVHFMHNYELGMRMLFQNNDKLRQYQVHPEHVEVGEEIWKIVEGVAVMDFEVAD